MKDLPGSNRTLVLPNPPNPIGSHFVLAALGAELDVMSSIDSSPFSTNANSGAEDIDSAVTAAPHMLNKDEWGQLWAAERGRLMLRFSARISDHAEDLAPFETADYGKPIVQARADGQVTAHYETLRCGQVFINGYGASCGVELPFSVIRKSGHSREKGSAAMLEFSHIETVVNNHS